MTDRTERLDGFSESQVLRDVQLLGSRIEDLLHDGARQVSYLTYPEDSEESPDQQDGADTVQGAGTNLQGGRDYPVPDLAQGAGMDFREGRDYPVPEAAFGAGLNPRGEQDFPVRDTGRRLGTS